MWQINGWKPAGTDTYVERDETAQRVFTDKRKVNIRGGVG